jgi:hypothetical protein
MVRRDSEHGHPQLSQSDTSHASAFRSLYGMYGDLLGTTTHCHSIMVSIIISAATPVLRPTYGIFAISLTSAAARRPIGAWQRLSSRTQVGGR